MPLSGWLCSPQGAISIGPLTIPADAAMGTVIQTRLPSHSPISTTELSMRLLSPVRPGGTITARGRVIKVRRTLVLAEVDLLDDGGELVGHGTSLCYVGALPAGSAPAPIPADPPREGMRVIADGPDPDPFARPAQGEILPQDVWDSLSGLRVLEDQIAGGFPAPPINRLLGLAPLSAGDGVATFTLPTVEWMCAPPRGRVQGGVVATLAEAAMMGAVQTRLPAGTAFAPIEMKLNYLRPLAADGRLATARGEVVNLGRRIGVASSRVHNADGKLVAIATGSAMILPGRAAALS
jgi:uncharacterized protein (TIGR00369 family)